MSDLTPEDVREILRAIDAAGYDEFELETPRFTLRLNRAPGRTPLSVDSTQSRDGLVEVTAPMVGTFYRRPSPGRRRSSTSAAASRSAHSSASSR